MMDVVIRLIGWECSVLSSEPIENSDSLGPSVDYASVTNGLDSTELLNQIATKEEQPVFGVEQMPQFPGGDEELLNFIKDNLRYPQVARQVGIEGRVIIRFVVNSNGYVTDVTVIRGLDPGCDKEAVRIVKMMPRWIPGCQNGRNVPVYYTLPVVYKLQK